MAKKNTLKANKLKPEAKKLYEVAIRNNDRTERVEFFATRVEPDSESLKAYVEDKLIAEFNDWSYYILLDESDEDETVINEKNEIVKSPKLPKDWGKID